jgi:hypothetical protein
MSKNDQQVVATMPQILEAFYGSCFTLPEHPENADAVYQLAKVRFLVYES